MRCEEIVCEVNIVEQSEVNRVKGSEGSERSEIEVTPET